MYPCCPHCLHEGEAGHEEACDEPGCPGAVPIVGEGQ